MADSCAAVRLQAKLPSRPAAPRRSIEAPPRQVIGFNVSPKPQFRDEAAVNEQLHGSSPQYIISPRSATSPRSVLQELLDQSPNKSQPATSTHPSNQNPTGNHRNPLLHLSSSPRASTNQKRPGGHERCQLHCASTAAAPPGMLHDNIHGKSSISEETDGVLLTCSYKDHNFRDDKEGLKSLEHAQNSSIFTRSNIKGESGHGEKGVLHFHHLEKSRKSHNVQDKAKKNSLFTFMAMSSSPSAADYRMHNGYHDDRTGIINNMDFLSSCHLCRCSLGQGQDVFMYSGDKAFCSMECRYQQIIIDERKERCPPSIIRSGPDRQSQDLTYSKSKLTMAHQYSHKATSSHCPNTVAAA